MLFRSATIEDGASFANLSAYVSGKINEYNFVFPTFVVRGNDKLSMFGTTGNEAEIPVVEPNYYDANTEAFVIKGGLADKPVYKVNVDGDQKTDTQ